MPNLKKEKIVKAFVVIDRETGELETLNGQLAIWENAGEPMMRMENFIIHSGKVVPCEITLKTNERKK